MAWHLLLVTVTCPELRVLGFWLTYLDRCCHDLALRESLVLSIVLRVNRLANRGSSRVPLRRVLANSNRVSETA
jgi:hypothetical protein